MGSIKEIENEIEDAVKTAIVEISEAKSPTQPHNGEKIDRIIVSQYIEDDPYAVTYSEKDNSILGWNIEKNGQQRPDLYFKLDKSYDRFYITSLILYKKILASTYKLLLGSNGGKYFYYKNMKILYVLYV